MKYLKYILLIVVFCAGLKAKAQQETMFTQYMNQLLNMNPAYAGAKGVTSASLLIRENYINWDGHPSTQTFFMHSPLNEEMGVGGSIVVDRIGPVTRTFLFGDYSYTITYPGERYLSLGLKAGASMYYAGVDQLNLGNLSDLTDPSFLEPITRNFLPNAGVGVYFSSPDYYLGFSVPKLISNRLTDIDFETQTISREEFHAFFMGGYVFDINRIVKFKPYFMVRMAANAPINADLTAQVVLIDKLWAGVTYRINNSFAVLAQVQVTDQLKVGYSYDYITNEFGEYNSGTHEVMLNFDFSFGRGRVRSPRYF
ncbi:MAG TPA: type IX secretion system membrane protein PorP/SprF [Prolixibacteraceae bacterium]|nr:type IX secretion system membrane protein PorP/SprF [Prolixibacteraceae bacterium]